MKTPPRNYQCPLRLHGWHLDETLENLGVGPLSRKVGIRKLICSFLDVSLGHPLCQKPVRLLSGTTSVLLDSMDDTLENPGVGPLSRKVEIWKLINSFLDGWHLDDTLENLGVGALFRKVEIRKLICSFLDVSLGHPLRQKPQRLLSGTLSILLDYKDDTWRTLWRTQELDHFLGW